MKKSIILILITCISAISVCSCNYIEESKYPMTDETSVVLEVTAENSYSEEKKVSEEYLKLTAYIGSSQIMGEGGKKINVLKEYKNLRPADISEPNISERVFTIMNKQYSGVFLRTDVVNFNTPAYVYKASDGTQITVDQNGNIVEVEFAEYFSYYVDYPDPNDLLSVEEYNNCATVHLTNIYGKEIASRYIVYNTTMYTNVIKVYFEANDIKNDEYTTNDRIMIKLDTEGNLLGYYGSCVGLYNNKIIPVMLKDDFIIEMVRASLAEISDQIEVHIEKKLVILSDGRMACYANFRLIDGEKAGDWAKVLIPLE